MLHATCVLMLIYMWPLAAIHVSSCSYVVAATWNCHPRVVLVLLQHGADMSLSGADGVMAADVSLYFYFFIYLLLFGGKKNRTALVMDHTHTHTHTHLF
jgi:hypothetical protein